MMLHELGDSRGSSAATTGRVIELHEHAEHVRGMRRARIRAAIGVEAGRCTLVLRDDRDPTREEARLLAEPRRWQREQLIEVAARGRPRSLLVRDARSVVQRLLDELRLRMLRDEPCEHAIGGARITHERGLGFAIELLGPGARRA